MLMSDLTKRELLAGMAMQGLLSNHITDAHNEMGSEVLASFALEYADALLAELARTEPKQAEPDNDRWIAHKPGDADGPPDDAACSRHIEVRFRNNETHFIRNPHALHWTDTGGPHTIIAWRPAR